MTTDFDALFDTSTAPAAKAGKAVGNDFDSLFSTTPDQNAPDRTWGEAAADAGTKLKQGVVQGLDSASGLVNLATFGGLRKAQVAMGLDPDAGDAIVKDMGKDLSPKQQEAEKNVNDAKGFVGSIAALKDNPLAIAGGVLESLPSMVLPFGAARGMMGTIVAGATKKALAAGASEQAAAVAGRAALEEASSAVKIAWAAHAGEGAESAGQIAQNALQANPDDQSKMYWGVPAGFATAVIGRLAGKVPGFGDAEAAFFSGGVNKGLQATGNRAVRVGKATVQEGAFQELPQSMQEQGFTNAATDKPIMDGVLEAGAQGLVVGGALGGLHAGVTPSHEQASHATETPSAPQVAAKVSEAPQQPAAAPAGPSKAQAFASNAFADVGGGDEAFLQQKQTEQGVVALSLSQLENPEELQQAVAHLSGGDPTMEQRLMSAAQDPELIAAGRQSLDSDVMQYVQANHDIRESAGLLEQGTAAPADDTQTDSSPAVAPALSMPHLEAQVAAVKEGLTHGAVLSMDAAQHLDLNGLEHGVATDQSGEQQLIVAKDAETVQTAVARANEVGLQQAAMELQQPVQGRAVMQTKNDAGQVVGQSVVAPEQAGDVVAPDGHSVHARTVDEVLADRAAALPEKAPAPVEKPIPTKVGPAFFSRQSTKSAAQFAPTEQTGAAARLVERLNQGNRLSGDQAISAASLTEVKPSGPLSRMQKAVGSAFGVNLVFVHAPNGLMRNNGDQFNTFSGVADREGKTIFMNVEGNAPLAVMGHELAHILESEHPAIYDKVEIAMLSRMRAPAALRLQGSLKAAMEAESGADGHRISAEFRREVVAEAIGELSQDPKVWVDIFSHIGEDGTAAKTFYQKVLDVIAKLQRALTSAGFIEGVKDVASAKKHVVAAYKSWAAEYERTGENQDNLTPASQEMLSQFHDLFKKDESKPAEKATEPVSEKKEQAAEKPEKAAATATPKAREEEKPAPRLTAKEAPRGQQEADMEGEGGISFEREKPVYTHEVVDPKTGKVMGEYQSVNAARAGRDRFDLKYGAVRYAVRSKAEPAKISFSRAMDFAREVNTYRGERGYSEGVPQPKGTPVEKLFSNFGDSKLPADYRDMTGQGRTREQAEAQQSQKFRGAMFDRANAGVGSYRDVISETVPFDGGQAVVTTSKIGKTVRVQVMDASGERTAAVRLERGKIDSIATTDAAKGQDLGRRILVWLKEQGLANIAEVPDRSPGFVQAQKAAFGDLGSDVSFARNALKMESVQDALDFAASGNANYNLGDAIDRGAWAEAYQAAKSQAERDGLVRALADANIELFADSKIQVIRWVQSLPLSDGIRQRLEGDMRRADTVRSYLEKEATDKFTEKMFRAIQDVASETKKSTDQVKKWAGSWMAAVYVPEASAQLITKDRTALLAAQATGDANAISLAQKNLADRIADVNGSIGDAKVRGVAGGLNNAEAAEMVRRIETHLTQAQLQSISKHVYAMLDWKKDEDLKSGKVTQTMVNSWLNSPRYVPLTGDPRADRETTDVFSSGGQVNQDIDRAMNGRKDSIADDGIDAAYGATIKSINFAAMQDFKRTLNKAYEQAQAGGHDIGLTREPVTGIMRTGDNVIIYRDAKTSANGLQQSVAHAFKFKDERIMGAIKRDNVEKVNRVLTVVSAATRFYARSVTQFMPMFAPLNLVRDIWERSELLRTKKLYDAAGGLVNVKLAARAAIADTINRDVWKASMMKAFKRGGMTPVRGDLEEMVRLGGSSTWGAYLERSAGDLEAAIRGSNSKMGHARDAVMHKVEAWNEAFEMIPSLSIYRALKAQGMEAKDAAAATLDLMNFRKKGTAMPAVKALYIFAQPAATSGHNLAQYLSTRTGQIRFATQTLIGVALYAMLKAAWGDDDDEELGNKLDNLSNFTIERTIPIKLGGYVLKLPVGFGPPQLAWQTAGVLNRWVAGRYSAGDAIGELAKGWAKNFAPLSPSDMEMGKRPVDFWMQTFTPTVLKPIFSIYSDQNAFGSSLTPVFKDANKLKSEQAQRATLPIYKDLAKTLHDSLGVDMYPDQIKALSDGYLVGPLQEILKMTLGNEAKRNAGQPERLPLISSLIDSINDRAVLGSIYSRVRADMDQAHREFGSMNADPQKRGEITPEMRKAEQSYLRFQGIEKVLGGQRSALKKMQIDDDTRNERLQSIEERADQAHRKLLVQYFGGLKQ